MKLMYLGIVFAGSVACAQSAAPPATPTASELVVEWNETLFQIAEAEDGFLTLKGLRAAAMAHIAMHDALSGLGGGYAPFLANDQSPGANPIADPVAAANEAAFTVAADQFPDQTETLTALRNKWLNTVTDGPARHAALKAGEDAAHAILSARNGDGWDGEAEYNWHPMAPGVYAEFNEHSGTPEGFVFGAGWAKAKGFALTSPDQFRAPPPPPIKSDAYTAAFNEVKEVGRFQSITRTPDQTHLALWWKDFAENSHNRLARTLVRNENLGLESSARLFALINMSIFDAYVSVFDNKFFYNHWRPYTAIRWAANDENPDTAPEETWTNTHRHTYAFPSYPSAHGAACAAAMSAFEKVLGDNYAFTMRTPSVDIAGPFSGKIEMHPAERSFASFGEAATECAVSRVYLGIHFRYDSVEGERLGRRVGSNVVENLLVERPDRQ
jgi:membrane-associated phospholipid phosphatase